MARASLVPIASLGLAVLAFFTWRAIAGAGGDNLAERLTPRSAEARQEGDSAPRSAGSARTPAELRPDAQATAAPDPGAASANEAFVQDAAPTLDEREKAQLRMRGAELARRAGLQPIDGDHLAELWIEERGRRLVAWSASRAVADPAARQEQLDLALAEVDRWRTQELELRFGVDRARRIETLELTIEDDALHD